ncbi:MAG: 3,4-dihydroxy-2-butanone-4-phosphate synthase [Proteobacteria bacterium]|nr:3,4-dihydroxy-2-butanone-4-phosphate synthase [Pseudomonadota bacterium]
MSGATEEAWRVTFGEMVSPIEAIIEEARNGRMFILVDDEGRENEGDLVIPAQMATPDAINFMAKHGRGLICLALTRERVEALGLPLMAQKNETRHETAFTVSIEARVGVTTGISAPDRARTVAVAIDPATSERDIVCPGHVFPVVARDGGVLVRTGHTEAAVDLARLAGLNPAGVICEIMNDDGTMARRDDLIAFAQRHGLKIATIADLIAYRRRYDRVVERTLTGTLESRHGGIFKSAVYVDKTTGVEHIALWKGELSGAAPVLVRVHVLDVLDDALGERTSGKAGELERVMRLIDEAGRGVLVVIREPTPTSLSDGIKARLGEKEKTFGELRDYGVGAQILLDLGVTDMIVLSNTKRTIVGLDGYGLKVVEQRPIPASGD